MKKIIISMFAVVLVAAPMLVASAQEDVRTMNVEGVLSEIMQTQNISQIQGIDCSKVTNEQFEELGDAVMEVMHPGEAHEQMDQMMGGEGSDSLEAMHIQMGRNYLGCYNGQTGYYGGMMGGMMGPGIMAQPLSGSNQVPSVRGNMMYGISPESSWQQNKVGFMPMMGGFVATSNFSHVSWSVFTWLFSIALFVLIILGIAALGKYLKK